MPDAPTFRMRHGEEFVVPLDTTLASDGAAVELRVGGQTHALPAVADGCLCVPAATWGAIAASRVERAAVVVIGAAEYPAVVIPDPYR